MKRLSVVSLSAAFVTVSAAAGFAADLPVLKAPPAKIEHGNLFYGFDADSHGSLVGYLGALYAPYGLHQSGVRLTAFGLYGKYDYDIVGGEIEGRFWAGDLLIGWSTVGPNGAATLSVGANYQNHRLSPSDPANPVSGSEWGAKVQGDFWFHPTPDSLVLGLASYSTAFDTYYGQLKLGYDFTRGQDVYFGPEFVALGNDRTDQVRVGAHLTGIKLGIAKLNISGGWLNERGEGDGWYGTGTVDIPF
ncbi:MAG: cellulose biosynthesis protein BcsS [Bradyrhizobiaceae bacterium]|nr:cellulose biosynthesis protein BcsS [Bradyrhizobiaceae bacterium]